MPKHLKSFALAEGNDGIASFRAQCPITMTMLARALETFQGVNAQVSEKLAPLMEKLAPIQEYCSMALPYAVTVFHYTFIPVVIFLGMRTEPRPALRDLFTPI